MNYGNLGLGKARYYAVGPEPGARPHLVMPGEQWSCLLEITHQGPATSVLVSLLYGFKGENPADMIAERFGSCIPQVLTTGDDYEPATYQLFLTIYIPSLFAHGTTLDTNRFLCPVPSPITPPYIKDSLVKLGGKAHGYNDDWDTGLFRIYNPAPALAGISKQEREIRSAPLRLEPAW